jgi:hypothetical protein
MDTVKYLIFIYFYLIIPIPLTEVILINHINKRKGGYIRL